MKKTKIYVVPHAHWDKEWYFTKQESDVLLNLNLKNLFEAFKSDKDFKNFTYDGQTSIVDDYTLYSQAEEIQKFIKQKKLLIGPWYSQPDLFNTTSEGIVRNLLIGTKLANQYGNCMKVAYVPDSFGQNSQMPQIFKKAGLENLVYWRGVRKVDLKNSVVHYWEGIDGTKIKATNLLLGYWIMGSYFPYNELTNNNATQLASDFLNNFSADLELIIKNNQKTPDKILIPLGGDQAPINKSLPAFFSALNAIDEKHEWIWSTYEEYFNAIKDINDLPVVQGELKFPEAARIHKTIASQRYDIKKLLKANDNLVFDKLEPLMIYFENCGGTYQSELINEAIKKCLVSSAHDSLGGCNSDETNTDVYVRLRQANDIFKSLLISILRYFADELEQEQLLIFNPSLKKTTTDFELTIFTKSNHFLINDKDKSLNYNIIDQQFINDEVLINHGTNGESLEGVEGYYKTKILLVNYELGAFASKILTIKETNNSLVVNSNLENNIWKIIIDNGYLQVENKKFNKTFENLFMLRAYIDDGDSYDFSPLDETNNVISEIIHSDYVVQSNDSAIIIKENREYKVNEKLNQKVQMIYAFKNNNEVDVKINLQNVNDGIKWVTVVDSEFENKFSYASQAFSEISHPVEIKECESWRENGWAEKPHPIETNENFIYLKDKKMKIGLITFGNNEYEITGDKFSEISLTLFRSVSFLGKHNLLWRPGRASGVGDFTIKTKDSELKKDLKFEFTFFIESIDSNIWEKAQAKLSSPVWYQKQSLNKYLHKFERFFLSKKENITLKNDFNLELLSEKIIVKAFKKTEDKKNYMIRLFNPTNEVLKIEFKDQMNIIGETNLLEEEFTKFNNLIKPNEIKTILVKGRDQYE